MRTRPGPHDASRAGEGPRPRSPPLIRKGGDRSFLAISSPATALHLAAWTGAVTVVATSGSTALALCLGFLLWLAACLLPHWHLAWTAPEEPVDADLDR